MTKKVQLINGDFSNLHKVINKKNFFASIIVPIFAFFVIFITSIFVANNNISSSDLNIVSIVVAFSFFAVITSLAVSELIMIADYCLFRKNKVIYKLLSVMFSIILICSYTLLMLG